MAELATVEPRYIEKLLGRVPGDNSGGHTYSATTTISVHACILNVMLAITMANYSGLKEGTRWQGTVTITLSSWGSSF